MRIGGVAIMWVCPNWGFQALLGVNLNLAMTGQEEVQWKVFTQLGLSDAEIRGWFNGLALLTWSRGQNEHGAGIAGPLPRSWMKGQWALQKRILGRCRELGIVGQLPAFQGNVQTSRSGSRRSSTTPTSPSRARPGGSTRSTRFLRI